MAPGDPAAELVGVEHAGSRPAAGRARRPARSARRPAGPRGVVPRPATASSAERGPRADRSRTPAASRHVARASRPARLRSTSVEGARRRAARRPGPPTDHQAHGVPDQDSGDDAASAPAPRWPLAGHRPDHGRGHRDHHHRPSGPAQPRSVRCPLGDVLRGAADHERRLEHARARPGSARPRRTRPTATPASREQRTDGRRDARARSRATTRTRSAGADEPEPVAQRPDHSEGHQPPARLQVALGLQPGGRARPARSTKLTSCGAR